MKATDPQIIREIIVQEEDHSVHAFTRNALTQPTRAVLRMKAASDQKALVLLCKMLADSNSSARISHAPTSSVRVATDSSMAISATKAISHVRGQTAISPGITTMVNRMAAISHVRVAISHVVVSSHARAATDSSARAVTDSSVRVVTDSSARVAISSVAATDSSVRGATSSVAVTDSAHQAMIQMPSTA